MASFFPSSSNFFTYSWIYDVFISFRGCDTRHTFTSNLYKSLSDKGIHTFMDDKQLEKGEEITTALVKNIKESRFAIVVFSKNYASSTFCLDELATIMEYVKGDGRLVLSVFYGVDPSDVQHQIDSYGEAMTKHEKSFKDMRKLQRWRKAFHQAANLSNIHIKIKSDKYEYESIVEIVELISSKIKRQPLYIADYPVGLESHLQEVYSLLNDGFDGDGVLMVGIHGIGGIGKSTAARYVYNLIADQFDCSCFLDCVGQRTYKHGLEHLQETLLSEMLHEDIKLTSVHRGIPIIMQRFSQKKVLLILDDVDKPEQLEAVAGDPNWFGLGSRVIITTRDKHLLASLGIERTYEVEGLRGKDAVALFTWNAFKNEKADPSYMDYIKRAVACASGLPLALEVIGSNLYGKSIDEWRSLLDKYEIIPNKKILDILQISFDALKESEKQIFLDIVCCYNGFNALEVKEILYACHHAANYGLIFLDDKSLVMMKSGLLQIHDLILEMGREIIRQESIRYPGQRSRLWHSNDIVQILQKKTGTSNNEIIILDAPKSENAHVEWDGDGFKKMENLRILIVRNVYFLGDVKYLPNSLRVLEWWNYPSNSLPSDFHPKNLAIFKLPGSNIVSLSFVENRKFHNLGILTIDKSNIEQIPDVSGVPNLTMLSFKNCRNLIEVHESVGFLYKIVYLGVSQCSKLRTFPPLKLPSLVVLNFSECSSLEHFPVILGDMEALRSVKLNNTLIKEFPRNLEEGQGSSESATFGNFNMLDDESVATFHNVVSLDLSNNNNITFLPETIKELYSLKILLLDNCKKIKEVRGIPPNIEYFSAKNCMSMSPLSRNMLLDEELHNSGRKKFHLPGDSIPKWFEHISQSNSVCFWFRNKLPPFSLCVTGDCFLDAIINGKESYKHSCSLGIFFDDSFSIQSADHLTIFDKEISFQDEDNLLSKTEWNHVMYRTSFPKKIGIHIHTKNNMEDIRFTDPQQHKKEENMGDFHKQQKNDSMNGDSTSVQGRTALVSTTPSRLP